MSKDASMQYSVSVLCDRVSLKGSFAPSVFLSGSVCRVRGAISGVKLWLLFTFAQQKHAYSSAKQNHSRCRYSDTQKQLYSLNSCTSAA